MGQFHHSHSTRKSPLHMSCNTEYLAGSLEIQNHLTSNTLEKTFKYTNRYWSRLGFEPGSFGTWDNVNNHCTGGQLTIVPRVRVRSHNITLLTTRRESVCTVPKCTKVLVAYFNFNTVVNTSLCIVFLCLFVLSMNSHVLI